MANHSTAVRLYLELTAHLIDREIAKFRRGEQAALVSFTNVANLAENAREELMVPDPAARRPMPAQAPRRIDTALSSVNDDEAMRWADPRVLMLTGSWGLGSSSCSCAPV